MRVSVRVKPGASRTKVGGQYGEPSAAQGESSAGQGQPSAGQGAVLIVFVAQRAVDGAATEGVMKAVAKAFGLRRADVELVRGHTARTKVLELTGDEPGLSARLVELLRS